MAPQLSEIRSAAKTATLGLLTSYGRRVLAEAATSQRSAADIEKYAIISTPRVGSTMFCRKIEETGRLGWPGEWINDRYASALTESAGKLRADAYLDLIVRGTATSNGIFGINFHVHQYQRWKERGLDLLKMGFRKIYWIERRDKVAQAFSLAKAMKTDLWSKEIEIAAGYPHGVNVEITPLDVAKSLASITAEVDAVSGLFPKIDRCFYYEDLAADGGNAALNAVLADFGQELISNAPNSFQRQSADTDQQACDRIRRYFSGI